MLDGTCRSRLYTGILFCVVCIVVSLPLHDSCARNAPYGPKACYELKRNMLGLVLAVLVLLMFKKGICVDEKLAIAMLVVLCVVVMHAHVPSA